MNAVPIGPPPGWVSVAKAADMLTATGDKIDASNVSRYLARYPWNAKARSGVPQLRVGKYRYVDPAALSRHRKANVLVLEKQDARTDMAATRAVTPPAGEVEDLPDEADAQSPIQQANLDLRRLQIKEKQLALAEQEGKLVPDHEVLALITTTMQSMISAFESEEVAIVQQFGREVGAAFRRARKAAQARASSRLAELAKKHLPPALSVHAPDVEPATAAA